MNRKTSFFITRGAFGIYLSVLFLVFVFGVTAGMAANWPKSDSNISFRLQALSDNLTRASKDRVSLQTLGLPDSGPFSLIKNNQGRLLVYIRVTDAGRTNTQALENNGASITHVDHTYKVVTAFIDLSDLKSLAALSFVKNIMEVTKPMQNQAGCPTAVTSEGDTQLKADQARSTYSVDGSGVTVGVLSDSYAGITTPTSAEDDILTGDLPGADNPCGYTTPVVVVEDYLEEGVLDEGRAMMQIVHDLAPGATLAFATAYTGLFEFADNIRKLRNEAGADIIVDDISYLVEPFFQDGPVSTAITEVTADGALYFTSAGNSNAADGNDNNIASYEAEAFRPTTCPTVTYEGQQFTIGNACHSFDPNGDTPYQEFEVGISGYFIAVFQWAEAWYGVETDLDLFITDSSYNVLAYSAYVNPGPDGSQTPYEVAGYQNTSGDTESIRIIVARYEGGNTPRSKYVLFRSANVLSSLFNASNNTTDIFGPSIAGHAGSADALSIAAVPYNDSTTPELFTSNGYYTVYYGPVTGETPADQLLFPQVRQKPDAAATDGGANTFFGREDGSVYRFYGTSASAPHAAAVAALMSQKYQSFYSRRPNQKEVERAMENGAVDIPNGGQTITGAGLLDAVRAIDRIMNTGGGGGGGSGGGCFISIFE